MERPTRTHPDFAVNDHDQQGWRGFVASFTKKYGWLALPAVPSRDKAAEERERERAMRIVIDEPKRRANLAKHGIDFGAAATFDWRHCLVLAARQDRSKAVGILEGSLVTIIFRRLGTEGLSIISMRPASRKERKLYGTR